MSISLETLNTTYADLRGPLVNSFVRSNELFETLLKKSKMTMDSGTYIERTIMGGAPARGTGIYVGDELLNMQRRQQTRKFQVEPHRMVISINIPKYELNQNSGKLGVIKLLEAYPKATMDAAQGDLNAYLLTGASRGLVFNSSDLYGIMPLNGQFTSGRRTGTTNGLLDFVATTAQADTVQSVAKSSSYYHFNQYGAITNWATDGLTTLRKQYRKCAHYMPRGKGPDLVIMDDDTYTNFENSKLNTVRLGMVEDKTEKTNMLGLDLGMAKVYSSLDLDRTLSAFTGVASNGITYMLSTDYFEWCVQAPPKMSPFQDRVADQDVVTSIFEMQGGLICTHLPAQAVVSGGAI